MPQTSSYGDLSLWHATAGDPLEPRVSLTTDLVADVCIVGAGYTGLWTAYYLAEARPDMRIVVVDKEIAGFGASGRNGGWASALFPKDLGSPALDAAMRDSVDEVIRAAAAEGIDADIAKGGTVVLARSAAQWARAQADAAHSGLQLLDEIDARALLNATDTLGGTYTPDCAAIHPAKLVRGLARAVEARGVPLYEQSPVIGIGDHVVTTASGSVTADVVVRATEGYTPTLPGFERELIPVYSLVIATAPLPESVWAEIGLRRRETFSDYRNLIIYGQRTADNRLVFGGRGAPYHFNSRIAAGNDRDERVFASLYATLLEMFPVLRGTKVTHSWGGALGIPRDWCASVGIDRRTGLAWAGGYVGDGVTTTNLAGRTLRDLILGTPSPLVELPWVNHRSPTWEPEPFRWLGVNAGLRTMTFADTEERVSGRPSLAARLMTPFLGGH
ncbi:NAD(P)/FAD-dependent oxidoreductase [Nocardioides sp. Kera G14]|uniref:NAD(P)/FAD-dependent oxidoreductase n=1 Tax=Nocardioides sp. Kera G14 TaxID=2884264 RepID=UPI001D0FB836|nr:FAD-dependent oxidoreductase [Nocardioides sp. Kera G14]UDY22609.1 FAD-binding oxidoreductase [Nocardioides sp. Kera G14]